MKTIECRQVMAVLSIEGSKWAEYLQKSDVIQRETERIGAARGANQDERS